MPTPKRGKRLGGSAAHQKSLMRNQATELFRHGGITTTEAKAKFLRPYAEKLITKAKNGDLHNRRLVIAELKDRDVVAHLFEEVAPRFADRPGGYTRIVKLGPRKGDNAKMALIELVDRGTGESGEESIEEAKGRRSRGIFGRRRRRGAESRTESMTADKDVRDKAVDLADDVVEAIEDTAAAVAGAVGLGDADDASDASDDSAASDDSDASDETVAPDDADDSSEE